MDRSFWIKNFDLTANWKAEWTKFRLLARLFVGFAKLIRECDFVETMKTLTTVIQNFNSSNLFKKIFIDSDSENC